MQSKGEAAARSVLALASVSAVAGLHCLVLVISFGLARFENRGTRCQRLDGRGRAKYRVAAKKLRTDWNTYCRDITMLEFYQRMLNCRWC